MTIFTNPADAAPEAAFAYVEAILGTLDGRNPNEVLSTTPDELRRLVRDAPSADLRRAEARGRCGFARGWNLALLGSMPDGDLDRVGVHSERGEESVRHMVRLYAGHDLVHLAQVRRILAGFHETRGER